MGINERVKNLRTALNLTQTEFGEKIGLKQSSVGQLESGVRSVTDRTIILLSQKHGASEEWLRTGEGEMFSPNLDKQIDELATQHGLNAAQADVIKAVIQLPDAQRDAIVTLVQSIVEATRKGVDILPSTNAAPDAPEVNGEEEAARGE